MHERRQLPDQKGKIMKIRVMYRQVQRIPFEKLYPVRELDKELDREEGRIGFPKPKRYRMFSGGEQSQTRVQEREFETVSDFSRAMALWAEDEKCQRLEIEKKNFMEWERCELYYVDDPEDPVIPWIQMAAEKNITRQYEVNENYKMPKDQETYKG